MQQWTTSLQALALQLFVEDTGPGMVTMLCSAPALRLVNLLLT